MILDRYDEGRWLSYPISDAYKQLSNHEANMLSFAT